MKHPIFICNNKTDLNPLIQENLDRLTWKGWKTFHHYDQLKNKTKKCHYLNGVQKKWEKDDNEVPWNSYSIFRALTFGLFSKKLFLSSHCDITLLSYTQANYQITHQITVQKSKS